MKEHELCRGVIFEPRESATIFGNYIDRTIDVISHAGRYITAADIDAGLLNLFDIELECPDARQIQDMIWEGSPVNS